MSKGSESGVDIYLVRHGEVEANVGRVLVGRGDSPFTPAGVRHPLALARALSNVTLAAVYTSPMRRSRESAERILEALARRVPLSESWAIAEIDAGELEGLRFEEVRERAPDFGRSDDFRYPGGESWGDVQRRALEFVTGLERAHPGASVLLVTHAGVIASLVAHYLGEPVGLYVRVRFGHDFVGRLRVQGGLLVDYARLEGTVDRWV